ncbi:hypothetical protein ACFSSA_05320 [Luteolibacter algae]|uniref:Ferric reductase like transmembrane component n=1 Tax=Luteolibacter algae TaxID=454151 RepID=A0ABW5D8W2_9BACT
MAIPVKALARRRMGNTAILLAVGFCAFALCYLLGISLRPSAFYSGLVLMALVLVLTFFNARKKLPFLPLVKASHWLQFHIYAGLLSIFLYGIHTSFRVPSGKLELALGILFLVVSISGILGLFITRILPKVMARSGEPLTFEKISAFEVRLRKQAEELILSEETKNGTSALGDAYLHRLSAYFRPRSPFRFFLGNPNRFRARALDELRDIDRYTSEEERPVLERMKEMIEAKHNLDVQKSCQFFLRCWLFVHIPFTYSMVCVALVHAWAAFNYTTSR